MPTAGAASEACGRTSTRRRRFASRQDIAESATRREPIDDRRARRRLLRAPEQSAVDCFREDVSLHRLQDVRSCLERVGGWWNVDLRVQRVELEHVVMPRTVRSGARAAEDLN